MRRDRQPLTTLAQALLIACALHASVGVALLRARFATPASSATAAATELDLDLSNDAVDAPAAAAREVSGDLRPREPSTLGPLAEARRSAPTQQKSTRTTRELESGTRAGSEGEATARSDGPVVAGAKGWSFSSTTAAPVDVFGGGVVRREPSPEGSHTRDLAPSAGVGGSVLAVTEDAVRTSLAPDEGSARFSVVVWKNGDVHAALLDASSANEQWSRVLGAIEGAVKRRGVHIPDGAKGVLIEMTLESAIRYVDGRRPANAGTKTVVQGLGHEGSVMDQMPMIGVRHEGRYCGGAAGLTPAGLQLGGGCSPENAAPATRHVRGQITQESRID